MRRVKRILKILSILPLIAKGQAIQVKNSNNERGKGIHFETKLSWQQIKEKAKNENKYIFIDCYATWCEPCRFMDKNIYPRETVGAYLDSNFVSIKVQMDTTKLDLEEIKDWYPIAHNMQQEYKVAVFPTYLFFSPEGRIVHKGSGVRGDVDFINLAKNARNSDKQYYTLLEKYSTGNIDVSLLPYLARTAKSIKERELANSIARVYFVNYLFKFSEEELCTRKNIEFISEFDQVLSASDKCFDLFYRNGAKVDSVVGFKGQSQSVVNDIITKEEITPILEQAYTNHVSPKWGKIFRSIEKKYGSEYADRNVLSAKVIFCEHEKKWKKHIAYFVKQVAKYGVGNTFVDFYLNNSAWYVFEHSYKKKDLGKALSWSERAIQISDKANAGYIDTKANLLYKLGQKNAAIEFEEIAVKLDPNNIGIKENFEKMKKNIPTWPAQ